MLRFSLLGPLEVFDGGDPCPPTPPKVSRVLALLLLRANQVVPMDSLIEEVWGEDPPLSATGTMQTYIYQLRRFLDPLARRGVGAEWLLTRPPGYFPRIAAEQLDITSFERLVEEGRRQAEQGRPEQAAELLRRALDLWRGPALADVTQGTILRSHTVRLEELRLRALELRIQADAELGRHRDLVGEIRSLVAMHPFHEWLHGQLIVALSHSGRRGEALQAYQDLRRVLRSQLGLDPQPELQRLQHEVLIHGRPAASSFMLQRFVPAQAVTVAA